MRYLSMHVCMRSQGGDALPFLCVFVYALSGRW